MGQGAESILPFSLDREAAVGYPAAKLFHRGLLGSYGDRSVGA